MKKFTSVFSLFMTLTVPFAIDASATITYTQIERGEIQINSTAHSSTTEKYFFIMRGLSLYNQKAEELAAKMQQLNHTDCYVVSTDRHVDEFKENHPDAAWSEIRDHALSDNHSALESLMKSEVSCIIYADMNIAPKYSAEYLKLAQQYQYDESYFVISSMDYNHEKPYMKKHAENAAKEENQFQNDVVTVTDENNSSYHLPQLTWENLPF